MVPALGRTLGDELLRVHRCYLPAVAPLLERGLVKGMAHITGGGLPGNLPRALPHGLGAALDSTTWSVPPIFTLIAERGAVPRAEMYRAFNMGIGFVLICAPAAARELLGLVPEAHMIGHVTPASGEARVTGLT